MHKAYHFSFIDMEIGTSISPKLSYFRNEKKIEMESVLERIRLESYNEYPSRLDSLFLAPTINSAQQWCKIININHWRQEKREFLFYVYEIETEENLLWFDADKLGDFYTPNYDAIKVAHSYWSSINENIEQENLSDFFEAVTSNAVKIVGKYRYKIDINGDIMEI